MVSTAATDKRQTGTVMTTVISMGLSFGVFGDAAVRKKKDMTLNQCIKNILDIGDAVTKISHLQCAVNSVHLCYLAKTLCVISKDGEREPRLCRS